MFESDDFDQVLSQFDFPEVSSIDNSNKIKQNVVQNDENIFSLSEVLNKYEPKDVLQSSVEINPCTKIDISNTSLQVIASKPLTENIKESLISPKHTKRKLINSHFDHKIKRKFPGPAGLLSGTLEETKDDTICQMELLSQDIEFSQNCLRGDLFASPLWLRLLNDVKGWNLENTDNIKSIKQQALAGNLRKRKAQTVTAFIETVDRSAIDPLIILRDSTGHIKCTLHRDAWSRFSTYIVSEYCALVLWKPTVLTTGGAYKKHYLNITLNNIYAIYSSAIVPEEERQLPEGFMIDYEDDYTVIKLDVTPQDLGSNLTSSNKLIEGASEDNLIEDLDSLFSDDIF